VNGYKNNIRSISRFAALILAVVLAAIFPASSAGAQFRITLNGAELPADEAFEMRDLELFMPLDAGVLAALDAVVAPGACDGECFTVSAFGATLGFALDSDTMEVDGYRTVGIQKVYKTGDVYYVPAAAFFQALDFDVKWDEEKGLLSVGYEVRFPGAQERLSSVLGLKSPEEVSREKQAAAAAAAGEKKNYLDYTFDDTIKMVASRVGGDKSQSRTNELGDYYNQFNLRYQGLLSNGYEFMGILRTGQTTEPELKKGEVRKLELTWWTEDVTLRLYDAQPRYDTKFIMSNNPIQGIEYSRRTNLFTWKAAFGKTPKELRKSLYARYSGVLRLEKEMKNRPDTVLGATYALTRDTGSFVDDRKLRNYAAGLDLKMKPAKGLSFRAEAAEGYNERFSAGFPSSRGRAVMYKMNYTGKGTSGVASYERTGNDFYSETSSFTRGRRDGMANISTKLRSGAVLSFGARDKKVKDTTTRFYPLSLSLRPLGGRDSFNIVFKRDFEKTTGGSERIVENKEVNLKDELGKSRVESKFSRQKNKTPGGRMYYREQKSFTVKSPLSRKVNSDLGHKRERWKMDRAAAARQSWMKVEYEPEAWTNIILNLGRYYNTPANARYTSTVAWHKVDIFNDREWEIEYKFDNYRDYNVNSASVTYSFFR